MTIYKLLKILSSESKAKMVIHFMNCVCGDITVTDICDISHLKQANASKHIMALRADHILESRKIGRKVIYCMNAEFKEKWGDIIEMIVSNDETLSKLRCHHEIHCKVDLTRPNGITVEETEKIENVH